MAEVSITSSAPWWAGFYGELTPVHGSIPIEQGALGVGAGAIALARLNDIRANLEAGYGARGFSERPDLVAVPHGLYDTVLLNLMGRSPTKKGLEGIDINPKERVRIKALLPLLGPQDYFVVNKDMQSAPHLKRWREGVISEAQLVAFFRIKYQTYREVREVRGEGREGTVLTLSDGAEKKLGKGEVLFPRPGKRKSPLTRLAFQVFQHQVMGVPSNALPSVLSPEMVAELPRGAILTFDQKSFLPGGELVPTFVEDRLKDRPDVKAVFVGGLNFAVMSFRGEMRDLELASKDPAAAMLVGRAMAGDAHVNPFLSVATSPHVLVEALGSAGKNIIALMSGRRLMELVIDAIHSGRDEAWVRKIHHRYLRKSRDLLKAMARTYGIDPSHPFSRQVLTDYDGTTGVTEGSIQYGPLMNLTRQILGEENLDTRRQLLIELTKQIRSRNVTLVALLELYRWMSADDIYLTPEQIKVIKITVEGVSALDNYLSYAANRGSFVSEELQDLYQYLWEMGEYTNEPAGLISGIAAIIGEVINYPWREEGVSIVAMKYQVRKVPALYRVTINGLKERVTLSEEDKRHVERIDGHFDAIQKRVGWLTAPGRIRLSIKVKDDLVAVLQHLVLFNRRYDRTLNRSRLIAEVAVHLGAVREAIEQAIVIPT